MEKRALKFASAKNGARWRDTPPAMITPPEASNIWATFPEKSEDIEKQITALRAVEFGLTSKYLEAWISLTY